MSSITAPFYDVVASDPVTASQNLALIRDLTDVLRRNQVLMTNSAVTQKLLASLVNGTVALTPTSTTLTIVLTATQPQPVTG